MPSAESLTATIAASLATPFKGVAIPQFALGVSSGLMLWLPQLVVQTVDTGTLGVGSGVAPFALPSIYLTEVLLQSYAENNQIGPQAPIEATALGQGLALALAQGVMTTTHPSVGVGTGVARVYGPPAFPSLMQGFAVAGLVGQGAGSKANAISTALVKALAAFTSPIPIVGPSSPTVGGGTGIGRIL